MRPPKPPVELRFKPIAARKRYQPSLNMDGLFTLISTGFRPSPGPDALTGYQLRAKEVSQQPPRQAQ